MGLLTKCMKRIATALFAIFITLSSIANAQSAISRYELPAYSGTPYFYSAYTVLFNEKANIPSWVAWKLDISRFPNSNITIIAREGSFSPDEHLGESGPTHYDYTNSGYDRGHMCPANDCRSDGQMMRESFLMTNVCPQSKFLNEHSCWRTLEDKCDTWITNGLFSELYIVCGPISNEIKSVITSGQKRIVVPKRFFKAIIGKKVNGQYVGIGFLFKQNGEFTYSSIDNIESVIKMDLFSSIPNRIQNRAEKMEPTDNDWPDLYIFNISSNPKKNKKDFSEFLMSND